MFKDIVRNYDSVDVYNNEVVHMYDVTLTSGWVQMVDEEMSKLGVERDNYIAISFDVISAPGDFTIHVGINETEYEIYIVNYKVFAVEEV